MNLYEIDNAIMEAYEASVDPDTGEINEEAYKALNELEMEKSNKIESILLWVKNLNAEAEALKAEKESFDARQRKAEKKAESLKRYVAGVLNGEKFSTTRVAISWAVSESVSFEGDIRSLPDICIRQKDPEINKSELKKLLKAGEKIPGAALVKKMNMRIR